MKVIAFSMLAGSILLTSCSQINNESMGTLAGGAVGGLIGSQFGGGSGQVVAAAGGAVLGAILGGNIGRSMDKLDRLELQRALETSQTGRAVAWKNPDTKKRYTVQPTRTYYIDGQPCREYTIRALIDNKVQQVYGKACRKADGSWEVAR